jgi:hypothetical protein
MQALRHKAVEIAVRTFFSDAVGLEHGGDILFTLGA